MNALEKMFNSIRSAPSKELKLYSTRELVRQLSEYEEHTLYILKNIYQLLTSESFLNRICGAKILNRMTIFEYTLDFHMSSAKASDYVYLQFKDIKEDAKLSNVKQRSAIKRMLSLEHVETEFLDAIELEKAGGRHVHKTAEYREKDIENVYDFFEAIGLILLSPDWFKRHGGFVAYCAMISSKDPFGDLDTSSRAPEPSARDATREDRIKIKLSGDLFNKIFEILKNDKFNDFEDDITSSPVRESASLLLKIIYPLLSNDLILFEITNLLTSASWQEQFSGLIALSHLKEYFSEELVASRTFGAAGDKHTLVDLLIGLLDSDDEDVKYISADLLNDVILRFVGERSADVDTICRKCWEQIEDEVDIAHSKASLIILLRTIYDKFSLPPPESFAPLYPCFTSSVLLIRNCVLELSRIFDGTEFLYLLAESILLEPHNENGCCRTECKMAPKGLEILQSKAGTAAPSVLRDFGNHFFRIISSDVGMPYREDDFGCYEEAFFTADGVKSIGSVHNLNNRSILFSVICGIDGIGTSTTTLLGSSFCSLYRRLCSDGVLDAKRARTRESTALKDVLIESVDHDIKAYASLRRMPVQEFKAIIEDPFYQTLYPQCHEHCLEYIRMVACANLTMVDFSPYFVLESSAEFLRIVLDAILCDGAHDDRRVDDVVEAAWKLLMSLHREKEFLEISRRNSELFATEPKKQHSRRKHSDYESKGKSHREIVAEQAIDNLTMFFEVLGCRLLSLAVFKSIMASPDRLTFFEHTIRFYLTHASTRTQIVDIFNEALEKRNVTILKVFISSIEFNCLFVKHVLETLDITLLSSLLDHSDPSFNVLFVKPVLRSMHSDVSEASRTSVQGMLSRIICSLHFSSNPRITDQALLSLIAREKEDVQMMVEPSLIREYDIRVGMEVQLRDYQKEGIKWLSFLSRFSLNGVLADDMGLGKTVQVLTFLVNEMYIACGGTGSGPANTVLSNSTLRSLIICPSSLCTHWRDELHRYFNVDSAQYDVKKHKTAGITICSYDTLRRDGFLESVDWFMIIFDEGHVLKNRSTVLYSKVKALRSTRKSILTGTPIHNSVEDIFSLFDIIMPGYFGTESEFLSTYGCKITDKNVQVMEARLDGLHRKILPFVMRRLKSDVLKDLPPKIIKDLVVELNPGHLGLYTKIRQGEGQETPDEQDGGYACLRKMSLVRTKNLLKAASHPRHFNASIPSSKTSALQDIFTMCGGESGQRKVLVFFQFKKTIDLVVEELQLTNYLRLDGTVPVDQRGLIASRFNSEPVPYLFLTTSVGGLGLNLTSADTVVFYEHSWNPFNDLQAMDRAHRLGQKNVVNVFRLISKDTIEEKVMNYQNFKLYVANTLITQQNNEIETMDTKDILERFQ